MNRNTLIGILLGVVAGTSGMAWGSNNSRVTVPNALNLEVGGRGLLYSLSYDRVLSDELLVGLGFGMVSMNDASGANTTLSATLFPAYLHYYFMREMGSLYASLGATLVTNANSLNGLNSSIGGLQLTSTPLVPTAGIGYEYRSDPGFLVRVTAYLMMARSVTPWGGFSVGYAF